MKNKIFAIVIFSFIFTIIFVMNYFQLPLADEWAQFVGNLDGLWYKNAYYSYMTWNARLGDLLFKFFMNEVSSDIFTMQKIFGVVNSFIIYGFLLNIFYLVKGYYPKYNNLYDSLFFVCIFVGVYYTSEFHTSFIWQSGGMNYGWALFFYSCFLLPYRLLFVDKKEYKVIIVFGYELKYNVHYFSLKEIFNSILMLVISVPIGMGSEITGPLILIGLAIYTLYLLLIKKIIPPLWFFLGGIGLFIGWVLLIIAPGPHLRNTQAEVVELSNLNIIKILIVLFERSFIYYNWIILVINSYFLQKNKLLDKKNINILCAVGGLFIFCIGVIAASLLKHIPSRTYITFTIFLLFVNLNLINILMGKYFKQIGVIALILLVVASSYLGMYYNLNKKVTSYIFSIEEQKKQGIKDIKIQRLDIPSASLMSFDKEAWIHKPMARYYQVDSIEFLDSGTYRKR